MFFETSKEPILVGTNICQNAREEDWSNRRLMIRAWFRDEKNGGRHLIHGTIFTFEKQDKDMKVLNQRLLDMVRDGLCLSLEVDILNVKGTSAVKSYYIEPQYRYDVLRSILSHIQYEE